MCGPVLLIIEYIFVISFIIEDKLLFCIATFFLHLDFPYYNESNPQFTMQYYCQDVLKLNPSALITRESNFEV